MPTALGTTGALLRRVVGGLRVLPGAPAAAMKGAAAAAGAYTRPLLSLP